VPQAEPLPTPAQEEAVVAGKKLSLTITGGPKSGEWSGDVTGQVYGVKPSDYGIAVFIKVRGGWWTKPTWASPVTSIGSDGSWSCPVITGGVDEEFTHVKAYLVKINYTPDLASGGDLPYVKAKKSKLAKRRDF
jgi:hypothetical protein